VTEERKSRKGLLWLGLGTVALMAGGSTFALWSANDAFSGGTITAGDLNLEQVADTAFYDVSTDRSDVAAITGTDLSGHSIDPATWTMVPGDAVAAVFSADVTLDGDNLVADLSVSGLAITNGNSSIDWTYTIYHDGTAVGTADAAVPADGSLLYLEAPGAGQAAGESDAVADTVYTMTDTEDNFTIVLKGTFDSTAGDAGQVDANGDGVWDLQDTSASGTRQDATLADTLADIVLSLQQVRDIGAQYS